MSIEIKRYSSEYKTVWDAFVANAKNATFLFYRDYMEYHADRFEDHSLLFYFKNKLIALLPAHKLGSTVYSHSGLTYGGIISDKHMKAEMMLEVFNVMINYFRGRGFQSLAYKTIPHIYHQAPSEEDLYALFKNGAKLYKRDVLSVIEHVKPFKYNKGRGWDLKKASKFVWETSQSHAFEAFMELEQLLLKEKYNATPVHTSEEISRLANLFPNNIKLFTSTTAGNIEAGVIIYETHTVAHCQYIGSTEYGRRNGALTALMHWLLTQVYATKKYFDFGSSMDESETGINSNLIANKESYGGRAIIHDHYLLDL